MSRYNWYLHRDLWAISDPAEQVRESIGGAVGDFQAFSRAVSATLERDLQTELRDPQHPVIQAAMMLELTHRLFTVLSLVRAAVRARTATGLEVLLGDMPFRVARDAIVEICEHSENMTQLPVLFWRWLFVWGGFVYKPEEGREYELLGQECGLSGERAEGLMAILRRLFSGGADLFFEDQSKLFLKYVPAGVRALGILNRRACHPGYGDVTFFTEDRTNVAHLLGLLGLGSVDDLGLSAF